MCLLWWVVCIDFAHLACMHFACNQLCALSCIVVASAYIMVRCIWQPVFLIMCGTAMCIDSSSFILLYCILSLCTEFNPLGCCCLLVWKHILTSLDLFLIFLSRALQDGGSQWRRGCFSQVERWTSVPWQCQTSKFVLSFSQSLSGREKETLAERRKEQVLNYVTCCAFLKL